MVVVCNFTPVVREDYRIGVPRGGYYREILNTDSQRYGGSNVGNQGGVWARHRAPRGPALSRLAAHPPAGRPVPQDADRFMTASGPTSIPSPRSRIAAPKGRPFLARAQAPGNIGHIFRFCSPERATVGTGLHRLTVALSGLQRVLV